MVTWVDGDLPFHNHHLAASELAVRSTLRGYIANTVSLIAAPASVSLLADAAWLRHH
jgi:hypothetical protein